jgi:hypothetical protein
MEGRKAVRSRKGRSEVVPLQFLLLPHPFQQTVTDRLNVHPFLRRVDGEHNKVVVPDEHFVFESDDLVVEAFGEVRKGGDVETGFNGLHEGGREESKEGKASVSVREGRERGRGRKEENVR